MRLHLPHYLAWREVKKRTDGVGLGYGEAGQGQGSTNGHSPICAPAQSLRQREPYAAGYQSAPKYLRSMQRYIVIQLGPL